MHPAFNVISETLHKLLCSQVSRKITFSEKTLGLCAQRLSTRVFSENGYFSLF